jgi:hypothetical protein
MYVHLLYSRLHRLLIGAVARATIDMLPDVALLKIFDCYVNGEQPGIHRSRIEAWHTLVHVCRNWRNVVFGSPRRLGLQLCCTEATPVRETLDIWPPLPILVSYYSPIWGMDNTFAALEHKDRISYLDLNKVPSSHSEKVLETMQHPFPALKFLGLEFSDETVPVDPASFLGGSAPRLGYLRLGRIPFPGLPNLLLSATHLADLTLLRVPHSGYISPEGMVACLSMLTRLRSLVFGFESPRSRPDRNSRQPPPPTVTRTLLPVLTMLWFRGVGEYLEDLVARIDAPLLDNLQATFFHQLIFDTPQLTRFISRTPKLNAPNNARLAFSGKDVSVTLSRTFDREIKLAISCSQSDWQLSSLAQVCSSSFPQAPILAVEHLFIVRASQRSRWKDDIENSQWLELLHPFTAVKGLHIPQEFTPRVAPALQELVGERVTEVLPALQTLFLEEPLSSGPVQEAIGKFVAARQLADCPIVVSRWERK